jgi:hypothetical protein
MAQKKRKKAELAFDTIIIGKQLRRCPPFFGLFDHPSLYKGYNCILSIAIEENNANGVSIWWLLSPKRIHCRCASIDVSCFLSMLKFCWIGDCECILDVFM